MATQSPFSFVSDLFNQLGKLGSGFQPPPWVVDETQHRVVLLLNHVLMQEPEAMARLARQKGQVVLMQWRQFNMKLLATPAGLLDRAEPHAPADLTLTVTDESPIQLAQAVFRGTKPGVRIEGDVQLAAEVNWLVDHVRWDLEEDLARVIGDAPAHTVGEVVRSVVSALRRFVGNRQKAGDDAGDTDASTPGSAPKAAP
jgi:ubiquinone biosynthesis protein UbiJ